MHEISAIYARVVSRHCQSLGIAEKTLFEGTALNNDRLRLQNQIELRSFVRFLENAQAASGDRSLGLLIGRFNNPSALGYTGLAISAAPGVREGLQAMEHFSRLQASYIQIDLLSSLEHLSIQFRFLEDVGDIERLHAEASVMLVQQYVEMVTGLRLDDAEYCMGFEQPEYVGLYSQHFHSNYSFGWPQTCIRLPIRWLEARSPYFNAELWQQAHVLLAAKLRDLGKRTEGSFTRHVSALLMSYEPPLPNLGAVAERLHLSERTLNRRLQGEGTSLRKLRAQIGHHWACLYLRDSDLSIDAIAGVLGYLEAANFRRAFRRLAGCTPSQYRAAVSRDDP